MNRKQEFSDDIATMEEQELHSLLTSQLPPLPAEPAVIQSIQHRLGQKIAASIARHAGLLTVRAREGVWKPLVAGIRFKELWQSAKGNTVLIEFEPGSSLPVHRHLYQEEGIVLRGSLRHDDEVLKPYDFHISPAGSRHGQICSDTGALAFLRGSSLGDTVGMAKEVLGGFLPKANKSSRSIVYNGLGWSQIQPGLSVKELCTDGEQTSRYYRIEPGTVIAGHEHPLDEECIMLSGELFIGDILLQAGDYQLAPAGTRHLDVTTDTGALLFVRGAV